MIDVVRKHDRILQTGSQQRTEFGQVFPKAVEAVRSGRIGQLLTVHVGVPVKKTGVCPVPCDLPEEPMEPGLDWDRWLGPAPLRPYNTILSPRGVHNNYPDWRLYREYSGGMITDFGAHHFDIAQWGIGADDSGPVQALPPLKPGSMFGARLIYASGVEVIHGGPGGVLFTGSSGWVHVDRGFLKASDDRIIDEPLTPKDFLIPRSESHHKNWLDAVASRKRPICDVEVGARSVAVCHLVNLVYDLKRPLTWDPSLWEFPGDAEANARRDYQRRDGYALPTA
jgi:predicted dehydrogenase